LAIIKELHVCDDKPQNRTTVSADYCWDGDLFQIRTYKSGDHERIEGSKKNIQFDKNMAKVVIDRLHDFLEQ